ncbi:MAG: radical SAM protein, partial [Dehalococcoidales bacterium]|nr:radical SAM protein [Dehalococcoidales bacterium]
ETAQKVHNLRPDIVGITAVTPSYHIAKELAGAVKALDCVPVAVGGPHITILKEKAFDPIFDYAFVGEAERSWPLFLYYYRDKADFTSIKGILFRRNGQVQFTGMPPMVDVNYIPFPARHLLKMDQYRIGTLQGLKKFSLISASRGCPFSCTFCAAGILGKTVRWRLAESVVDEMASVVQEFNIRHFQFADDNLTLNRSYIWRLCDLVKGLRITFEGCTRANLLDEELVRHMADCGLTRLYIGLESVDPVVRKLAGKDDVSLTSHWIANRLCKKYHVEVVNHIMLGLPGETRATAQATIDYVRKDRDIHDITLSIATPYPGTELLEMARRGEHGLRLVTEDYSQYYRYGSAVMGVNDLSPQDLVRLQNDGFAKIYLAPWRWRTLYKKTGLLGVLLTLVRLVRYWKRKVL